jgi:glyoxylase-like metal-dependent hydrolase (beta-lactamase superfamily II)
MTADVAGGIRDAGVRDGCDRIICLTLGHEWQPRRLSLEEGGDELLRLPVIGVLVHGPGGWLLVDTGLSETMRDAAFARRIYRSRAPELPPGDALVTALAACGLTPSDLAAVAISHLHVDHTGGLAHFGHSVPVFIQRRELEFGLGPAELDAHAYVSEDYAERGIRWQVLDGDAPVMPGVDAIFTPGHTPGHMSFRVRTQAGETWIFAMDAIDLQDGIDSDTPIAASALPDGVAERRHSHARLMDLAAGDRTRLLPGHCPRIWPTLPGPPDGVDTTVPSLTRGTG